MSNTNLCQSALTPYVRNELDFGLDQVIDQHIPRSLVCLWFMELHCLHRFLQRGLYRAIPSAFVCWCRSRCSRERVSSLPYSPIHLLLLQTLIRFNGKWCILATSGTCWCACALSRSCAYVCALQVYGIRHLMAMTSLSCPPLSLLTPECTRLRMPRRQTTTPIFGGETF